MTSWNVIWNQATSPPPNPQKAPELSLGPKSQCVVTNVNVLFSCYKEELCSRLYMTTILVLHLKENLMDRVLNSWVKEEVLLPNQPNFLGLSESEMSESEILTLQVVFLFGGVKSAPLQTLPNNIYLSHKWSIYDKYCCENQRAVLIWRRSVTTLSLNNRGDLDVMVITLRRILATLVSLVIALARESLYKEEFLDLDLERITILKWGNSLKTKGHLLQPSTTGWELVCDKDYVNSNLQLYSASYNHDCVTAITYSPAQLSCDTLRDGAAGGVEAAAVPAPLFTINFYSRLSLAVNLA